MTSIFAIVLAIAIAISTSLLLVLLYNQREWNKTKKLLRRFNEAAAAFNLTITKQERLGNRVIGFDAVNNKVQFLGASSRKHDDYLIDLGEIQSCTVKNVYSTLDAGHAKDTNAEAFVNTIALQLDYINGVQPEMLPFYDKATDPAFEMRQRAGQAKEWQALLSTRLTIKREMIERHKHSPKRIYAAIIGSAASFRRMEDSTVVL